MLLGEGGDRIGEHEWALSDEEVEGSALIAELIAAQRENFAGREPVDSDQQRCEAGIERDGAIRREDADDVFELLFGDADRGFSAWECRNIEIGRDVAFGGPGKELREPSSRGAEGDELLDLCLSESAQGRLLFLSPGEEGDEAPQRCFDVPSCADRDVPCDISAGSAQQHPSGVGAQHLAVLGGGSADGLRRPGHQLPRGRRLVRQGTGVAAPRM